MQRDKRQSRGESSETERVVISRRELARELRRKAYRDAKARRDADPRFLAMKEAAKLRRRELYQLAKEKKKKAAAAAGGGERSGLGRGRTEERPVRDRSIKESSSKANAKAALARALGALREAKEQKGAQQPLSELMDCVKQAGEREGAPNDRS